MNIQQKKSNILWLCLGFIFFGLLSPSAYGLTLGDVNDGGQIDIVDALLTARYAAGLNPPGLNSLAADVNYDSSITIIDALLIARYSAALITAFPVPTPTSTVAPVNLFPVNSTVSFPMEYMVTYPQPDFTLNLQHFADGSASTLNWQFYELPACLNLATTTGTLARGEVFAVKGTLDWTKLPVGNVNRNYFYLYATSDTNQRYCRLITLFLSNPPAVPTPTPTIVPCGYPRINVSDYTFTVKYPATGFSFQIRDSGTTTTCNSGSFTVVIPELQKPYLSVQPLSGSVTKVMQTPTPTPSPTSSLSTTPTPSPTPAAGVVLGTINWQEVPAGMSLDYFCIVRITPAFNAQPTQTLITVHADRTAAQ